MNLQLPITIDAINVEVLIKRRGKWSKEALSLTSSHLDGTTMRFVAHKPMIVQRVLLYGPSNLDGPLGMINVVSPVESLGRGDTFIMELAI